MSHRVITSISIRSVAAERTGDGFFLFVVVVLAVCLCVCVCDFFRNFEFNLTTTSISIQKTSKHREGSRARAITFTITTIDDDTNGAMAFQSELWNFCEKSWHFFFYFIFFRLSTRLMVPLSFVILCEIYARTVIFQMAVL